VGLVCLIGFVALATIVTLHRFETTDRLAREVVHRSSYPLLHSVMAAASSLGGHPGQIVAVVLTSVVLWPRRRRWALSLPMVMAGAGLLQLAAKWGFDRPRPNQDAWGFPSAHVLTLVVLLGYIAYMVAGSAAGRRWRHVGVGACVAIVAGVAYSRMYLEAHWLSDVLGGLSGGLAYLLVAIWLIRSMPASTWVAGFGPLPRPSAPEASLLRETSAGDPLLGPPGDPTTPGVAAI
jgi:undecaprenyl-diphosphatase